VIGATRAAESTGENEIWVGVPARKVGLTTDVDKRMLKRITDEADEG